MAEESYTIVQNILRISAYLSRVSDRVSKKYNLNQQQFAILNEICSYENLIQKDLVDNLFYEKSNVSKVVKKMIKLGLIDWEVEEDDNRVKYLIATEEGEELWRNCLEDTQEWCESWLKELSSDEIAEALNITERIKENIQEERSAL